MRIVFQNVKFQSKTQEKNWFYGKMTGTLTWHYLESKLTFYIKKNNYVSAKCFSQDTQHLYCTFRITDLVFLL